MGIFSHTIIRIHYCGYKTFQSLIKVLFIFGLTLTFIPLFGQINLVTSEKDSSVSNSFLNSPFVTIQNAIVIDNQQINGSELKNDTLLDRNIKPKIYVSNAFVISLNNDLKEEDLIVLNPTIKDKKLAVKKEIPHKKVSQKESLVSIPKKKSENPITFHHLPSRKSFINTSSKPSAVLSNHFLSKAFSTSPLLGNLNFESKFREKINYLEFHKSWKIYSIQKDRAPPFYTYSFKQNKT